MNGLSFAYPNVSGSVPSTAWGGVGIGSDDVYWIWVDLCFDWYHLLSRLVHRLSWYRSFKLNLLSVQSRESADISCG